MVAMAERVNLGAITLLPYKGVVAGNAAVVIQTNNFAICARRVLRFVNFAGGRCGHKDLTVVGEGQTGTADVGSRLCAVEFLHLGERVASQLGASENGGR